MVLENKILMISNNWNLICTFKVNLPKYKVIGRVNMNKSLEYLESNEYALLILDDIYPDNHNLTGLYVLDKIRVQNPLFDKPIMMLDSHGISETYNNFFDMAGSSILRKPVNKKLLLSEVDRLHYNYIFANKQSL